MIGKTWNMPDHNTGNRPIADYITVYSIEWWDAYEHYYCILVVVCEQLEVHFEQVTAVFLLASTRQERCCALVIGFFFEFTIFLFACDL